MEVVPNGTVTIQLADGRTRTFAMADTTYAGPAGGDQRHQEASSGSEASPYATIHAERAKLALAGSEPNLTFHLQTAAAGLGMRGSAAAQGFSRLCTAPCEIEVPMGRSASPCRVPTAT